MSLNMTSRVLKFAFSSNLDRALTLYDPNIFMTQTQISFISNKINILTRINT